MNAAKAKFRKRQRAILVLDVGGSHVKMLASGHRASRRFDSGPELSAKAMVGQVIEHCSDWHYDAVSIGYPGPVRTHQPTAEPHNLGRGWVDFDYAKAFGKPVRMVNDAAMQALGGYRGGRMLFLGLGTGLGSAMIVDGVLAPMELGHLPYRKATFEDYVGERGRDSSGNKKWRRHVSDVIERLIAALQPDEVLIGGGNIHHLKELPAQCRAGGNADAFTGGFRLWDPRYARATA